MTESLLSAIPKAKHRAYSSSATRKLEHYDEWMDAVEDMLYDPLVLQMNNFTQHHGTSTYLHCRSVSYYSFLICRKLGLDARSAARAAMVHDLYLYNWRAKENASPKEHTLNHPQVALHNAERRFSLNAREREGISMHMWPAAPGRPVYPETYVISTVDKYSACIEIIGASRRLSQRRTRKINTALNLQGRIVAQSI